MSNQNPQPVDHAVVAPYSEAEFRRMGILEAWKRYADVLTFGRGQTLAILDDGCNVHEPEWQAPLPWGPKVVANWNAFDLNDDPRPGPKGYHGTTVGHPSSLNYKGKRGVAFNDFVIHIRACTIVHLPSIEDETLARGLDWVIANHEKYHVTAVNLAPVDDLPHDAPLASRIDAPLARLRQLNIWVSAPCANNHYTNGISWPACAPGCYAIGGVKPEIDEVHLDRCALTDILVPASATSSSNAFICGAAILLREAIEKAGYPWRRDGETLPEAMMAIFQRTGPKVFDPATKLTFPRLDVLASLQHVLGR